MDYAAFRGLTNAGSGIIAGLVCLTSSRIQDWLLVFPIWNIINSALLLLMLRSRFLTKNASATATRLFKEVIIGLIAVLVIFIFCNYVFKLHWAITFSICIIYTTSFDKALQSVFPGLTGQKDEQSSEV